MKEWDHDHDRDVDQVIGDFFVRRALFEELNGFDERFSVYFEKVDVCYRVRKSGWRSIYLSGAVAFHAGGGTFGQVKYKRLFYSLRSRLLYGFKHFSYFSAYVLLVVALLGKLFSRILFTFRGRNIVDLGNTLRGYCVLFLNLPKILKNFRK